jgi:hypothetical protein
VVNTLIYDRYHIYLIYVFMFEFIILLFFYICWICNVIALLNLHLNYCIFWINTSWVVCILFVNSNNYQVKCLLYLQIYKYTFN